jgi:hypothetical protein
MLLRRADGYAAVLALFRNASSVARFDLAYFEPS